MQSDFWVITNIVFANLCKPIHDAIIIPVLSDLWYLKSVGEKGEKITKNWISREQKKLFRWNKNHFS